MEFASEGCVELTGHRPEDLVGNAKLSYADLIHEDDRTAVWNGVQEALKRDQPFTLTYRIRTAAGEEKRVCEQGRGVFADGKLVALEGLVTDVTERKRSEEMLRFTQFSVDHAGDAVFWMARDARFFYANEAACRALGYTKKELLALSVHDIDTESPPQRWPETWESVRERGMMAFESTHRRKDGHLFPVEITANFLEYGGRDYICAFARDITDRRQAEQALQEAHDTLERRVAQRTSDLVAAKDRLEREVAERKRVEAALRESEGHQALLLSSMPIALFTATTTNPFCTTWGSEEIERMSGFSATRFVAERDLWASRIHPADRDRVFSELDALLQNRTAICEYRWRCADETYHWFQEQTLLIRDEQGEPKEIIGTWMDITERKQTEDAHRATVEQLQAVLDNSTAVIYAKDLDGRYILANQRYAELFHISQDRIIGKTDYQIHSRETAEAFQANDKRVLESGGPVEFEETVPQDDGVHTYLSAKFPLYDHDGRPYAICGMSTDITVRKQALAAIEQAKEAAEEASRTKSTFLANISHEIRTPLTALLGAAELLAATLLPGDDETARDRVDMVLRNGRHLASLIDDLLDLSRTEVGELEVRRVSCSLLDLLRDVRAVVEPLQRGSEVDFRFRYATPIPARIHTDPTRLKQAMINLVTNALKFTKKGHVWVTVAVDRDADDPRLSVVVADTGIGIAPPDTERVFETFTQIDPTSAGVYGGVGLGLPLTRWISQQLGGTLEIASEKGRGSTFTLRVATGPVDEAHWLKPDEVRPADASTDVEPSFSTPRLRGCVLIAEDFHDTLRLLEYALTSTGVSVVTVDNGEDAVRAATDQPFDLILMDVRMPRMSGTEATAELRRRGCLTPIIALTASTATSERSRLLEAGFDDHWAKPIALDDLVRRASAYLSAGPSAECEKEMPAGARESGSSGSPLLVSVVSEFVEALPARITVLRKAVLEGNLKTAQDLLHQLAGAGGVHGFMPISREAVRLSRLAEDGGLTGNPSELTAMETLVDRARESRDTAPFAPREA